MLRSGELLVYNGVVPWVEESCAKAGRVRHPPVLEKLDNAGLNSERKLYESIWGLVYSQIFTMLVIVVTNPLTNKPVRTYTIVPYIRF